METLKPSADAPTGALTDLEYAIQLILAGRNDLEFASRACERMDRAREELAETNAAVELIREARDEG